jgi:hypothetical protein
MTLLRRHRAGAPYATFVAGTDDPSALAQERELASAACRSGLDTTLRLVDGGHSFATVHRALVDGLPGLFDRLAPGAGASRASCEMPAPTVRQSLGGQRRLKVRSMR